MATIREQAAAIKGYASAIDAAIVAKGGTTAGGLINAASAIAAIPSGGGEEVVNAICTRSLAGILDLRSAGSFSIRPYHFAYFVNIEEIILGNVNIASVYSFSSNPNLKRVTAGSVINNAGLFTSSPSLESLTLVARTASQIITQMTFLGGIPTSCVIHCTDNDIKNVGGAWVIVERS